MYRLLLILTLAISLIGVGCNDPIIIEDVPGQNEIPVVFTDTFTVNAKTIPGEISSTYDLGINYSTYLLGSLDDPIFGKSTSNVYVELDYRSGTPSDFAEAVIDSAVLIMEYSNVGFYGDTTAVYDIEVRQMIEQMEGDTIDSDQVWATDPLVIGSRSLVPSRYDSLYITDHVVDDKIDTVPAQLRIPLTNSFGQSLLEADEENYLSRESLIEFINGLEVSATTDKSSMMGLNLSDGTNFSGNNKLRLFYTLPDTTAVFDFSFRSRTASSFTHDVAGAEVEPYLTDANHNGNDRIFMQGMSGVEVEFSFPTVEELRDRIINSAELVYYSVSEPNITDIINVPVDIATLTYINDDEERTLTTDATLGVNPGPYSTILGGVPTLIDAANGIYRTTVNLTSQFNTVFNRDFLTTNVILSPLQRSERSSRSIIFGSGDDQYKPVLKITYTDI